ncbi:MAG: shikimate dehydrogenase [Clostridia bacterium]|nr:shikimate dehydrogenase [Clostridia bacterium]
MMEIAKRIGPETARYAVLGEHLAHTWSPYIHNTLFDAAHADAVYLPMTIDREHLGSAVDVLRYCYKGFNVTIPYKELILPYIDELDTRATVMQAVNTVEVRDGRLIGHITDGLGMMRAIQEQGVCVDHVNALVLGGGGAARVAGYEVLERGGTVTFALRNLQKARQLMDSLVPAFPDGGARIRTTMLSEADGQFDLIINCTPVGMYPNVDACPLADDVICRAVAVFDAVYNPRETVFLKTARQSGIPAIEGFGMLYYQAVEAERFWDPMNLPDDSVQAEIYRSLLEQL